MDVFSMFLPKYTQYMKVWCFCLWWNPPINILNSWMCGHRVSTPSPSLRVVAMIFYWVTSTYLAPKRHTHKTLHFVYMGMIREASEVQIRWKDLRARFSIQNKAQSPYNLFKWHSSSPIEKPFATDLHSTVLWDCIFTSKTPSLFLLFIQIQ